MSEKLFRLKSPLISNGLISALRNPDSVSVEAVNCTVDLTDLSTLIDQLILEKVIGANLDARLVECVHTTFKSLPSHILTDMRMWHWLCVIRYPNIPWLRWRGNIPVDPEDGFTVGTGKKHVPSLRFLGTSSINGHGRNTFSRLFFAADRMMENDHSDYSLVKKLFTSQELHLGLSDREFGLIPKINRILTEKLVELPDSKVRIAIRKLNSLGGSICLDLLSEEQLQQLIDTQSEEVA